MPAAQVRGWRKRLTGAFRAALPQSCALCAAPSGSALVCAACARSLPPLPPACPGCALPSAARERCGRCVAQPPVFDRSWAPFVYAFPVDRLIQQYKYHGALAYADWFAETMLAAAPAMPRAGVIAAIPLARSRQRERGFNQALEIARHLSRRTGIPLAPNLATRVRDTPPQASLPWAERARNIDGAFACASDVSGQHVLVVDDVMTTGASLQEFARTLKAAGAASVENWVVARTLPPSDSSELVRE